MDLLTFISKIIGTLAWPITTIIFAFIFKKPISKVLENIESLTYKDGLVKFAKKTEQIGKEVEKQIPLQEPLSVRVSDEAQAQETLTIAEGQQERQESIEKLPRDDFDKIYMEVEKSPQLAIMQAWTKLEMEAMLALKRYKYFQEKGEISISPIALLRGLKEKGLLDEKQIQIFDGLRKLRNIAVHRVLRPIPEGIVLSYIDAAKKVYIYLKNKNL